MGTQAMGSQGSGERQSQFQNLARQGSLYNLTLNEVQSQLGEPLHSMNLDELLRNVLPGEGDQMLLDLETPSTEFTPSSGLQRQGSVTLSMALSKKTVDEIWRDIQQGHSKVSAERAPSQERQPTFGEMTLEDFLVKVGVVADGSNKDKNIGIANVGPSGSSDPVVAEPGFAQGVHWLQPFQPIPSLPPKAQQPQQNIMGAYMSSHIVPQPPGVVVSNILDSGVSNQMRSSSPMMGTLSDTQMPGRKRVAPGDVVEKTVERRQKRMIKNRESAARSRARKQAYTNELENKVTRLEKENERLKKQKELDKILYTAPQPEPKFQLRRTKSSLT